MMHYTLRHKVRRPSRAQRPPTPHLVALDDQVLQQAAAGGDHDGKAGGGQDAGPPAIAGEVQRLAQQQRLLEARWQQVHRVSRLRTGAVKAEVGAGAEHLATQLIELLMLHLTCASSTTSIMLCPGCWWVCTAASASDLRRLHTAGWVRYSRAPWHGQGLTAAREQSRLEGNWPGMVPPGVDRRCSAPLTRHDRAARQAQLGHNDAEAGIV